MQIKNIHIKDQPPIKNFEVNDLSNRVVIAGPNGIGKTRLVQSIIGKFQNYRPDPNLQITIMATNKKEENDWGKVLLNMSDDTDIGILRIHITKNRKRGYWSSSIINFESSRVFKNLGIPQWNWNFPDPSEEEIEWDHLIKPLNDRFETAIHSIYRKIGFYRMKVTKRHEEYRDNNKDKMPVDYSDPIKEYKDLFNLLLSPKKLNNIAIDTPSITYTLNSQSLNINSLSSGEKEVFTIAFDLLSHQPSDCIIFIDEPESHLHPELCTRLLSALESIGERNQFIFCTHSPDIITESLDHSVIFIKPPENEENQAIAVKRNDDKSVALNLLGQNLGIIAMGKKIVLIEGREASLDKQIYGSIIGEVYPQYVLLPVGPKNTVLSFSEIIDEVLSKALWGIDFYMITDHDSSLSKDFIKKLINKSSNRLAFLPRYHIENYFLDERVISNMLQPLVSGDSWQKDPDRIKEELKLIARGLIPLTIQLWLGSDIRTKVREMKISVKGVEGLNLKEYLTKIEELVLAEEERLSALFSLDDIKTKVEEKWHTLENHINTDNEIWKEQIPGRIICDKFSNKIGIGKGKFKSMYINQVKNSELNTFKEIENIFEGFNSVSK